MRLHLTREHPQEGPGGGGLIGQEVEEDLAGHEPHLGFLERERRRGATHLAEDAQLAEELRLLEGRVQLAVPGRGVGADLRPAARRGRTPLGPRRLDGTALPVPTDRATVGQARDHPRDRAVEQRRADIDARIFEPVRVWTIALTMRQRLSTAEVRRIRLGPGHRPGPVVGAWCEILLDPHPLGAVPARDLLGPGSAPCRAAFVPFDVSAFCGVIFLSATSNLLGSRRPPSGRSMGASSSRERARRCVGRHRPV